MITERDTTSIDLAVLLKQKRQRLRMTQEEAARASRIPYGTYVQAETYARMGRKVRHEVFRWLHEQPGREARST